jgi:hypothetical protein
LAANTEERIDAYIDLEDDTLGLKGRSVDTQGVPRRLELKVRTAIDGEVEEWLRAAKIRVSSKQPVPLWDAQGIEAAFQHVEQQGVACHGQAAWKRRMSGGVEPQQLRIVNIWKRRTNLFVRRTGDAWQAVSPQDRDATSVETECTQLALCHANGDRRSLGWTVCCEHESLDFASAVRQILSPVGGQVLGYPAFLDEIDAGT